MTTDVRMLSGVPWREYCPWFILAHGIRLATSLQLVALALAGVILVSLGWQLAGAAFLPADIDQVKPGVGATHARLARWPGGRGPSAGLARALRVPGAERAPYDPVIDVPYRMVEPFRRLLTPGTPWREQVYFLVGGAWSVAVWALLGGAITRCAVVRLGVDQRVGLGEALTFSRKKWFSLMSAPALPLAGIVLVSLPMVLLGWSMRFDVGVLAGGLLWLFVLFAGFLMAILGIGLLFGWPLMWGTISTESSDAFDAISRSYAYTFQRPLHYLFYGLVASVFGILGWLLLVGFVEGIMSLSTWGISLGAGAGRVAEIANAINRDDASATSSTLWLGSRLILLFEGLLRSAASAVSYSYFWCATSAIYLLLRRDTDQTEMDDVVLVDEDEEGLPPLETDDAGVPGVSANHASEVSVER